LCEEVKDRIAKVLKKYFPDAKIFLFGSRARGNNLLHSDYDIIIVSDKFSGISFPQRIRKILRILYKNNIDEEIEPLCYTFKEFEEKKKKIGILRTALKEAIPLT